MNQQYGDDDAMVVGRLQQCRPVAPSSQLRARVLAAARDAWAEAEAQAEPSPATWRFPLLRLAAALAAGLTLIAAANWWSDRALAPWHPAPDSASVATETPAAMLGLKLPPAGNRQHQLAGVRARFKLLYEILDSPRPEGMPWRDEIPDRQSGISRFSRTT